MRRILPLMGAVLLAASAHAQAPAAPSTEELQQRIDALQKQLRETVQRYDEQIRALQGALAALQAQAAPPAKKGEETLLPPVPVAPPAANLANPAISLIPDFTFAGGNDPVWSDADALQVREVELALSANIDPYARAFAALSMEGGEFDVEEAYAQFPGLPGGFSLKLGRFRQDFGKQNQLHAHTWFQADVPLALRTFLGEEGLGDTGVSLSHLLPTPWMSDLTVEVTGGRNEAAFGGGRGDLAYLVAWRNYWDLTDASNLEAQVSLAAARNETGRGTGLGNLSVTYRRKPPGNKLESFLWRTEYLQEGYRTPDGLFRARGGFTYVDWQFTRGWFLGARADYAEHPLAPARHESGGALVLTYYPSEFQKLRLQVQHYDYAGAGKRNALVFEYGFAIGPHGAHPF